MTVGQTYPAPEDCTNISRDRKTLISSENTEDCGDEVDFFLLITASTFFAACSNSNTFETGEIKALRMLEAAIVNQDRTKIFVDTKKIVTRKRLIRLKYQYYISSWKAAKMVR